MVLLIAMPHSSSTAARASLGYMMNVYSHQDFPCYAQAMPEQNLFLQANHTYHQLSTHHHDVCDMRKDTLRKWLYSQTLFKQHLVPTERNIALLKSVMNNRSRIAILLRNPLAVLKAACEGQLLANKCHITLHMPVTHVAKCAQLVNTTVTYEMLNAFCLFEARWQAVASAYNHTFMTMTFEQLAAEGRSVWFTRALEWYGVPMNRSFENSYRLFVNRTTVACHQRIRDVVATRGGCATEPRIELSR